MRQKLTSFEREPDFQQRSREWWQETPMSYAWRDAIQAEPGTAAYFDEIDRRFFSASPFFRGARPFARIVPLDTLRGKDVLEIGCGLGSHTELLASAGARVTSVDLTERAVETTRRRLALRALQADVRQADAERLPVADESFDLVWSWGVIHHSSHPERIMAEVHRVLRPGGRFMAMVYHSRSIVGATSVARGVLTGRVFRGMSAREMMSYYTDGYAARWYTPAEFENALKGAGFDEVATRVLGQTSELYPWPGAGVGGRWKARAVRGTNPDFAERILSRVGMFLLADARKERRDVQ